MSALDDAALGKLSHEDHTLSWKPLYAKVSGLVPLLETTSARAAPIVRCQLEVVTSGKIGLRLNDADGLTMWLDGRPVPAQTNLSLDLSRGVHELVIRADPAVRRQHDLSLELVGPAGNKGQAKFVDGR